MIRLQGSTASQKYDLHCRYIKIYMHDVHLPCGSSCYKIIYFSCHLDYITTCIFRYIAIRRSSLIFAEDLAHRIDDRLAGVTSCASLCGRLSVVGILRYNEASNVRFSVKVDATTIK